MENVYLFLYIFVFFSIALGLWLALKDRFKYNRLKKTGTRVMGTIITNSESFANSMDRLGGNINQPAVRFTTLDGQEITGFPVMGIITQFEIKPLMRVNVYYDPKQPTRFCID